MLDCHWSCYALIFPALGNMTDSFKDPEGMVSMALDIFIQYIFFGVGSIFGGWGMEYFWQIAGENQANKCRKYYI